MVVNGIVIAPLLTLVAIEFYKALVEHTAMKKFIGTALREQREMFWREVDTLTKTVLTHASFRHNAVRSDITELWGIVEEKHERVVRLLVDQVGGTLAEVQGALVEVRPELKELGRRIEGARNERQQIQRHLAESFLPYLKRIEEHATKAQVGTGVIERQVLYLVNEELRPLLEEIAREVSDPATLRILRKLEAAFLLGEGMESQAPAILSTTASPNMARQLEERAFSERTISTGADDLIAAAAARGITLPESEARRQAMLMLNDEEV